MAETSGSSEEIERGPDLGFFWYMLTTGAGLLLGVKLAEWRGFENAQVTDVLVSGWCMFWLGHVVRGLGNSRA